MPASPSCWWIRWEKIQPPPWSSLMKWKPTTGVSAERASPSAASRRHDRKHNVSIGNSPLRIGITTGFPDPHHEKIKHRFIAIDSMPCNVETGASFRLVHLLFFTGQLS
ncbi:hypothetical protein Dda3937_04430 [Dickeya dadantii 3937]|uniref:Uncharacterized protein n=1 Tax=Dickeya dadantii (strain 3937) TaxID=198628 RepID=E0SFG8_DICD3|nr:hypothetical protein Dda3937_04430 [Dickeya dadantii 3937]